MQLPDIKEVESYIRVIAKQYGIDPEIAVRVAKSEGLAPGVWQSNFVKDGKREQSYGPFQLYEGGGLGNKFKQLFGVSASDPSTWKQQVSFALQEAKKSGWSPWYGAARAGIGNFEGIRSGASAPTTNQGSSYYGDIPSTAPMQGPSFSPSQGPGDAQSLTMWDKIKANKTDIANLADSLGSVLGSSQPQMPAAPAIGPATGFAPLQIEKTRYTRSASPDMSILRQLGLI